MTTALTTALTPAEQVADLLLSPERLIEIEDLRDRVDEDTRMNDPELSAIDDLLDHVDGLEWLILGDDGPSLGKARDYLRVLEGVAVVYQRRVDKAVAAGQPVKGHEAASLAALQWAGAVLGRVTSVPLSRPFTPPQP